jgi:CDP-2,3-bis-(O-geranylgeranyl)-sn-glycerol synthase
MPGAVEIILLILLAPWLFLPAVLANMAPVFLGGKKPVDFGKDFFDGRRILGDGKTIGGTIGGTLVGFTVGMAQITLLLFLSATDTMWSYGDSWYAIPIVALVAFGALFGDLLGSFLKRRLNFERGAKFPIMDQYDLVIGVIIILLILPFSRDWFLDRFIFHPHWITLVAILLGTYLVHRISNLVAYKIGKKDVPW